MRFAHSLCLALAFGVAGCAPDYTPEDLAADEAAFTTPGPLPEEFQRVDWQNAALKTDGASDPNSDFFRAQSLMSKLAMAAYGSDQSFDKLVYDLGLRRYKSLHDRIGALRGATVDAFVGAGVNAGGVNFIAIKGSDEAGDYFEDLFAVPVSSDSKNNAAVHAGFTQYAAAIYESFKGSVILSCKPTKPEQQIPLWITGHSLGGAVATLVAQRFMDDGCNVRGVSTFGSPRPGLDSFKQLYNRTRTHDGKDLGAITKRFVKNNDAIPCTPPGGAWKHVGQRTTLVNGRITFGGDDDCGTFPALNDKLKQTLRLVEAGADIPLVVLEWIDNRIILDFLCPPGTTWDDWATLKLCTLTEKTLRLRQAFQMEPLTLFSTIMTLAFNHSVHENYGFEAAWDWPAAGSVPMSKVRFRLPPELADAPRIYDEVTLDYCMAERDANGFWICEFQRPRGARASYIVSTTRGPQTDTIVGCDNGVWRYPNQMLCEFFKLDRDRTVSFLPVPY